MALLYNRWRLPYNLKPVYENGDLPIQSASLVISSAHGADHLSWKKCQQSHRSRFKYQYKSTMKIIVFLIVVLEW